MTAMPLITPHVINTDAQLAAEAKAFFNGANEGGMGKWTYFLNNYWESLIQNARDYYLSENDILLVARHAESIADRLKDVKVLCEIGPGAPETIAAKTVPLVRAMMQRELKAYIAVDSDIDAAHASSELVRKLTRAQVGACADDLFKGLDIQSSLEPKALMVLGSTIGNLPGAQKADGHDAVQAVFNRAARNLDHMDDAFVFTFDTERREQELLRAYNGKYNEDFCLSFLHLIKEKCTVLGEFEPLVWRHEAVWHPATSQVAHIVFPAKDQDFDLDGERIKIKAGHKFVMNNSYKFSVEEIREHLEQAHLEATLFDSRKLSNNPMALAIAHRP